VAAFLRGIQVQFVTRGFSYDSNYPPSIVFPTAPCCPCPFLSKTWRLLPCNAGGYVDCSETQ